MICGGTKEALTPPRIAWLAHMRQTLPITAVILGGGRFLDGAVTAWAHQQRLIVERIPADWQPGHAHGALRVAQYLHLMARRLLPGTMALLALPGGEGTQYLVTQAKRLGLPVYLYDEETTMPEMQAPVIPEPAEVPIQSPVPMLEDDIPDVTVPETLAQAIQNAQEGPQQPPGATQPASPPGTWQEHESLLVGFLSALQGRLQPDIMQSLKDFGATADSTFVAMRKWIDTNGMPSDHVLYQLSGIIERLLKEGLQLRHDPYQVTVQALSPEGFPVEIHVAKHDTAALVEALPALTQWLAQHGYTPVG